MGWVQLSFWLGPKDMELRAPVFQTVKLGHFDCVRHQHERLRYDTLTACPLVVKARLGHLVCMCD